MHGLPSNRTNVTHDLMAYSLHLMGCEQEWSSTLLSVTGDVPNFLFVFVTKPCILFVLV
uniref:Uncharacterized protein n=1 Tax=Arundo donax TaxID=35708 RepID=A0A0A9GGA0_ARUDO